MNTTTHDLTDTARVVAHNITAHGKDVIWQELVTPTDAQTIRDEAAQIIGHPVAVAPSTQTTPDGEMPTWEFTPAPTHDDVQVARLAWQDQERRVSDMLVGSTATTEQITAEEAQAAALWETYRDTRTAFRDAHRTPRS